MERERPTTPAAGASARGRAAGYLLTLAIVAACTQSAPEIVAPAASPFTTSATSSPAPAATPVMPTAATPATPTAARSPAAPQVLDDRFGFLVHTSTYPLWEVRSETGRPLATIDPVHPWPVFSADGRLAFWRLPAGGPPELAVLDVRDPGKGPVVVHTQSDSPGYGLGLAWSADASGLAIAVDVPGTVPGIHAPLASSTVLTLDLRSGKIREVLRVTGGDGLRPVAWDRTTGVIALVELDTNGAAKSYVLVTEAGAVSRWPGHAEVLVDASSDAAWILALPHFFHPDRGRYVRVWPILGYDRARELRVSPDSQVGAAAFRPGSTDIGVIVAEAPPSYIGIGVQLRFELWTIDGERRLARWLPPGAWRFVFRADGSAVALILSDTDGRGHEPGEMIDLRSGDASPFDVGPGRMVRASVVVRP